MILACAVLIGSLCVPREYTAVAHFAASYVVENPHYDEAEARRRKTEIYAWSSDMVDGATTVGLDRVCDHGWCVYYRKHCEAGGRRCTYMQTSEVQVAPGRTGAAGVTVNQGFQIDAPSRAAMRRIIARLRFATHVDKGEAVFSVPLAELDRESPSLRNYISCMPSVWVEGCGPPRRTWAKRPEHL